MGCTEFFIQSCRGGGGDTVIISGGFRGHDKSGNLGIVPAPVCQVYDFIQGTVNLAGEQLQIRFGGMNQVICQILGKHLVAEGRNADADEKDEHKRDNQKSAPDGFMQRMIHSVCTPQCLLLCGGLSRLLRVVWIRGL